MNEINKLVSTNKNKIVEKYKDYEYMKFLKASSIDGLKENLNTDFIFREKNQQIW